MSDAKHITTIVKEYIDDCLTLTGKYPKAIYLSKDRLIEYEKELGCDRIDSIYGVKILSLTYGKYPDKREVSK